MVIGGMAAAFFTDALGEQLGAVCSGSFRQEGQRYLAQSVKLVNLAIDPHPVRGPDELEAELF